MKIGILIFIFLNCSILGFTRSPSSPYYFPGPNFKELLPFSKSELDSFKIKGVIKVEEYREYGLHRIVYHFNELGLLVEEESVWIENSLEEVAYNTHYKYNDFGFLTLKYTDYENSIVCDSISYDENNRINHYYSYELYKNYKNTYDDKTVICDYHIYSMNENYIVLKSTEEDSLFDSSTYCTIDNNNQVVLLRTYYRIDSLSVDIIKDSLYTKNYWYKTNNDSIFKNGHKQTFLGKRLLNETQWDILYNERIVKELNYTYDLNNQLLRIENSNIYQRKVFFTYNWYGLKKDLITVFEEAISRIKYKYYFR